MFRVIVAGGRDFQDYGLLKKKLDIILAGKIPEGIEIVSGTANGADSLGERYAVERGYAVRKFPAAWDTYGKSAGIRRNTQMAEYADALVALWDGKSHGTKHMVETATIKGLLVRVVFY